MGLHRHARYVTTASADPPRYAIQLLRVVRVGLIIQDPRFLSVGRIMEIKDRSILPVRVVCLEALLLSLGAEKLRHQRCMRIQHQAGAAESEFSDWDDREHLLKQTS